MLALTGEEDVDLTGDELSDCPSLDSDLDLDLDFLELFLGDLDLFLLRRGECDFDLCLRDNERDFERLLDFNGERFLLAVDRERLLTRDLDLDRRREGGDLDFVRLRGLLDLERRLRLRTTLDRDRVLLLLRIDRERRDRGAGDLLRRDTDRLLERLPPARLAVERDLERRTGRLDLEWERRGLVTECDRERLPAAPLRLGERVLDRFVPPRDRDSDLRLLLGD